MAVGPIFEFATAASRYVPTLKSMAVLLQESFCV